MISLLFSVFLLEFVVNLVNTVECWFCWYIQQKDACLLNRTWCRGVQIFPAIASIINFYLIDWMKFINTEPNSSTWTPNRIEIKIIFMLRPSCTSVEWISFVLLLFFLWIMCWIRKNTIANMTPKFSSSLKSIRRRSRVSVDQDMRPLAERKGERGRRRGWGVVGIGIGMSATS